MDYKTKPCLVKMFTWQHLKPKLEIVLLCVAIAIAWGLLSLPVVFFNLPTASEEASVPGEENCGVLAQTVATCSPTETYEGQTCGQYLSAFQMCLNSGEDDIHIAPKTDQSSVEVQAMAVVGTGLQLVNPSPQCEEVIRPFLCLYLFRLCDGDGQVYEPSCGSCVSIRDDICVREWTEANELLQRFGFPTLPVCEEFPHLLGECNGTNDVGFSGSSTSSNETEVQVRNCSTIHCREGFYCTLDITLNISICRPRCTWEQYPHTLVVLADAIIIFSALISLIALIAVLIISVIDRKRMFKFPAVFVVYIGITTVIITPLILISFVDRPGLYCSSLDLEESVKDPTPFCIISGSVFYYTFLQEIVWWLLHLIVFFWKVMFPFHAKNCEERHLKYAHVAGVLIALLVPLVPVVVTATNGGFTVTRFPPIVCSGRRKAPTFYTLVMLTVIFMQIGITLLLIILWKIHKQQGLLRERYSLTAHKKSFQYGTAEKRLLIVFCYYVLLGAIAMTTFTLVIRNADNLSEQINQYFQCEAAGIDPDNPCDRSGFFMTSYATHILNAFSYVLVGLLPVVSLVYAVDGKKLKQICRSSRLQSSFFPSSSQRQRKLTESNS